MKALALRCAEARGEGGCFQGDDRAERALALRVKNLALKVKALALRRAEARGEGGGFQGDDGEGFAREGEGC